MNPVKENIIRNACQHYGNKKSRMLDILWEIQDQLHGIDTEAMEKIAGLTGTFRVEVEGVVSFYAFFSSSPKGQIVIRLCDDIVDRFAGLHPLLTMCQEVLGIQHGETTGDGSFSLETTPCIGMCDQAPAALINNVVFPSLTPAKMHDLLSALKQGKAPASLVGNFGDGNNGHASIKSSVNNNIRLAGPVLLSEHAAEAGLQQALTMSQAALRRLIENSGLRGRGGAGYPIGKKLNTAAKTVATHRYVICNADEGEPGTFKDRVLLTEQADCLIEGLTIAALAIGAEHGILYLRAEYRYLHQYLSEILDRRRQYNLLGNNILGSGFNFDIRIQLGAGAYICGEESSLISSCEGRRGEPTNRPPFPAEAGYMGYPTVVNNVETLCNLPSIVANGDAWFRRFGTPESTGTKLLSISGDCQRAGVYEVEFGITLQEVLAIAGAQETAAVQVGGASGAMINRDQFNRRISFEDLPTAGAIIPFSSQRNILDIAAYYLHFFIEESCGYCTPCRVGNVFMKKALDKIRHGQGDPADISYLKQLGKTIIATSRCGLGHTSPNPVLSTISNFPLVYAALVKEHTDGLRAGFNIQKALDEARRIAKRRSLIYDPTYDT